MSFPERCYARFPFDDGEEKSDKRSLLFRMIAMFKSLGYQIDGSPEGWTVVHPSGKKETFTHERLNDWIIKQTASAIGKDIHRSSRDEGTAIDGITDATGLLVVHEHVRRAGG